MIHSICRHKEPPRTFPPVAPPPSPRHSLVAGADSAEGLENARPASCARKWPRVRPIPSDCVKNRKWSQDGTARWKSRSFSATRCDSWDFFPIELEMEKGGGDTKGSSVRDNDPLRKRHVNWKSESDRSRWLNTERFQWKERLFNSFRPVKNNFLLLSCHVKWRHLSVTASRLQSWLW